MHWHPDTRYRAGGWWSCTVKHREYGRTSVRRARIQRKENGICTRCGREPLLTDALCWSCLNDLEDNRALRL